MASSTNWVGDRPRARFALVAVLAALLVGCGGPAPADASDVEIEAGIDVTGDPAESHDVEADRADAATDTLTLCVVRPEHLSLEVGTRAVGQAFVIYGDGDSVNVSSEAAWASSDEAVLGVDASGVLTGLAPGAAEVRAIWNALTCRPGRVAVYSLPPFTLQVYPRSRTLRAGGTAQLDAVAVQSDGRARTVTDAAAWSTSAPSVATVSSEASGRGLVSAVGVGEATITASYEGMNATAAVTVEP